MGIYVGVNGTPKEVTAVYVGVNGTPKECSDIYVGVNGTPKSCYSGVKPGETIFTSSTNFTVPRGVKKIDCFCVGGGGAGGSNHDVGAFNWGSGLGGGGGYTTTKLGASVTPGQQIAVTVGAGGVAKSNNQVYSSSSFFSDPKPVSAPSSIVNGICEAAGGNEGWSSYSSCDGGSGGGWYEIGGNGGSGSGGQAGSDGGNGICIWYGYSRYNVVNCGKGQGTTTRYFGESDGTLYAGGGGGGCGFSTLGSTFLFNSNTSIAGIGGDGGGGNGGYVVKKGMGSDNNTAKYAESGATNTGGGGGGGNTYGFSFNGSTLIGANGGSGICIIRWDDQKS